WQDSADRAGSHHRRQRLIRSQAARAEEAQARSDQRELRRTGPQIEVGLADSLPEAGPLAQVYNKRESMTTRMLSVLFFCLLLQGQQPLSNDAVAKMAKAGLGEDIIVSMIATQPGTYSTGAEDVVALKRSGVTDKVIAAMLLKVSNAPGTAAAPGARP